MGAEDAIRDLYAAIERSDVSAIGALLIPEVFVLPGSAAAAIEGRKAAAAALDGLRIRSTAMSSGVSDSGRSAWVFDQIEVEVPCDDSPWGPVPVRLTALLDDEDGWRVRAAHWSIPLPSNAKQQELRAAGKLPDGAPLEESVPPEVGSLADRLRHALTGNAPVPELYSVRDEAITIGSVTDEIFPGPAGKAAWEKFIDLDPRLEVRGGIRGGITPDGSAAWLAAHIDIIFSLVAPYRFFYVWVPEDGDWKIVVSHDSVSNWPRLA
jgi:ketosteroid isomerase-like protein